MTEMPVNEVLTLAGRAIGKIERLGKRGLSMITERETEALVLLAVAQGMRPVARDEEVKDAPKPRSNTL